MPYIVVRRGDIPSGSVQITDLYFNKSQARVHNGPVPQGPIYLRPIEINKSGKLSPLLTTIGGDIKITNQPTGLTAYILTQVDNDGASLTLSEAVEVALYIVDKAYAAEDLDTLEADLQADINGDYHYSDDIENLLKILSGEKFVVSPNTTIETGGNHVPLLIGSSNFPVPGDRRLVTGDTAWVESLASGQLYQYTNVVNYYGARRTPPLQEVNINGITHAPNGNGNPLCAIYLNDGTVFTSADI
ncbi:hypothetical protein EB001_20705 [bacterium]|jgi:hypothetical protein|nr:hypothetical protein [bacterium]